jgi:succinylarginine dihydrolase
MWVANAATVTPSSEAADGRVHFTPANLVSKLHRSLEPLQTERTLRAIFHDEKRFAVHAPVPGNGQMGDEGAANHTRFVPAPGMRGLHLFVYGHYALGHETSVDRPVKYASRQARETQMAITQRHGLPEKCTAWARQSPAAIDAGVFHNDVIATGHGDFFLCHEEAFVDTAPVLSELREQYARLHRGHQLNVLVVPRARVSLADAVRSYLFNSQIVTARGKRILLAPAQCEEVESVRNILAEWRESDSPPFAEVRYLDLRQSMRNGGGPACLRLRVVLNEAELNALPPDIRFSDALYSKLVAWVGKHYRAKLSPDDLGDPSLLEESRRALDELSQVLGLGSIYPFQQT